MRSRARCWAKARRSTGDVRDRLGEILHNYEHDLPAFALYARTDARLAYQIVEKLNLVPLAFARSQLTGMTPDRVAASIASFDFLYLSELERRGIVAPTVRSDDSRVSRRAARRPRARARDRACIATSGCSTSRACIRASSARSTSIRCRTSPTPRPDDDLIETPGGAFRREPAILPRMLDELFPRREAAKQAGDEVASHAIKILMNSFYGVLGTPACRFFNPALANSITGIGPRDAAVVEALVRSSAASGCCTATRTACSSRSGADDPRARRGARGAASSRPR